jgi:VanZ family protein
MNSRRLILVLYVAALFFATHCPLRRELRLRSDSWYHAVLDSVDQLTRLPLPGRLGHFDKVAHLVGYALLTFLAFRAAELRRPGSHRSTGRPWRVHPIAIVLILLAFGAADETTQPFFGRTLDWYDYFANVMGILSTTLLLTAPFVWKAAIGNTPLEPFRAGTE